MASVGVVRDLDLPRWGRLLMSATGIVGTATFLAINFTNVPLYGDALEPFARWAGTHQSDARHLVGLLLLTVLLYAVFAVYVASSVGDHGPWSALMVRLAVMAVAARIAIEVVQLTFLTAAGSSQIDLSGSLGVIGSQLAIASLVPHMVFLGAIGVAMLAGRELPRWLGWLAVAACVVQAWALLVLFAGAPAGPLSLVWYVSIPAWPLVTGVTLFVLAIRTRRRNDASRLNVGPANS